MYKIWRDPFVVFCLGLVGIIVLVFILFFLGDRNLAWFIGCPGTVLYLIGQVIYVSLRDPENKWPDASSSERLINLFSFKR